MSYPCWRPIETFDRSMFSIMSSGIPDSTEIVKYKGDVPEWARFWMPLPGIPPELKEYDEQSRLRAERNAPV